MRCVLLVICLLLETSVAAATIYKWEDSRGSHFADDPGAVPFELRSRALPEDDNGVVTFSRPVPFNSISAQRHRSLEESARQERKRDLIVREGIRQHQEEIIRRMAGDRSTLQTVLVRLFTSWTVILVIPILLLLFFWVKTLVAIARRGSLSPALRYRWLAIVLLLGPFGMVAYYLRPRPSAPPPHAGDDGSGGAPPSLQ